MITSQSLWCMLVRPNLRPNRFPKDPAGSTLSVLCAICSSSDEFRSIFATCIWSFEAFLHHYSDYLSNQNPLYSSCGVEIAGTVCLQNVLLFSNLTIFTCAGSSHLSSPANTWANFTRLFTTLWPGQMIKVVLNALTLATILSHVPQHVSKNFFELVLVFVCARVFTSLVPSCLHLAHFAVGSHRGAGVRRRNLRNKLHVLPIC